MNKKFFFTSDCFDFFQMPFLTKRIPFTKNSVEHKNKLSWRNVAGHRCEANNVGKKDSNVFVSFGNQWSVWIVDVLLKYFGNRFRKNTAKKLVDSFFHFSITNEGSTESFSTNTTFANREIDVECSSIFSESFHFACIHVCLT